MLNHVLSFRGQVYMFLTAPEKSLEISVTPYFMVSVIQSNYLLSNELLSSRCCNNM